MIKPKIHFLFDRKKEPDASFAKKLIAELGQTTLKRADHVVSVGGDGNLLRALWQAAGKKVTGIVPPTSNSTGFWTNRGVRSARQLLSLLGTAKSYPVKPLKADIQYADGSKDVRYAYNDMSVQPVHKTLSALLKKKFKLASNDVSKQSALLNISTSFDDAVIGPMRVMGSGILLSTALGSTAMNRTLGGPSVDIRQECIILTGMGISSAPGGFRIVNDGSAVVHIDAQSIDKRPLILSFDSFSVLKNDKGSPITRLTVSTAHDKAVQLVLNDDPGLRAYVALTPH